MGETNQGGLVMKLRKTNNRRKKNLKIKELEKRVVPSPVASKKPPAPPPYAPGTLYGLVSRRNLK